MAGWSQPPPKPCRLSGHRVVPRKEEVGEHKSSCPPEGKGHSTLRANSVKPVEDSEALASSSVPSLILTSFPPIAK